MAKMLVTFQVDSNEMFDRLAAVNGEGSLLGNRLIGVMLTGEASFSDKIGLSYYGVEVAKIERLEQDAT